MGCGSSSEGEAPDLPDQPQLTDDDKQHIRDTWAAFQTSDGVHIFVKMFALAPDTASLFGFLDDVDTTDVDVLGDSKQFAIHVRRTTFIIDTAVQNLHDFSEMEPVVARLGGRHQAYGAKVEHYPALSAGVLYALEKGLQEGFTAQANAAWTKFLNILTTLMVSGYK